MKEKNKGITLIALIITIIVMLILTGVSVNVAFGENGIITKARNAAKAQKLAQIQEKIQEAIIASYDESLSNIFPVAYKDVKINMIKVEDFLREEFGDDPEITITSFFEAPGPIGDELGDVNTNFHDIHDWANCLNTLPDSVTPEHIQAAWNTMFQDREPASIVTSPTLEELVDISAYIEHQNNEAYVWDIILIFYTIELKYDGNIFIIDSKGNIVSEGMFLRLTEAQAIDEKYIWDSSTEGGITLLSYFGEPVSKLQLPSNIGGTPVIAIGDNNHNQSEAQRFIQGPTGKIDLAAFFENRGVTAAALDSYHFSYIKQFLLDSVKISAEDKTIIAGYTDIGEIISYLQATSLGNKWYTYFEETDNDEYIFSSQGGYTYSFIDLESYLPEGVSLAPDPLNTDVEALIDFLLESQVSQGMFEADKTEIEGFTTIEQIRNYLQIQDIGGSYYSCIENRGTHFNCIQPMDIIVSEGVTTFYEDAFNGSQQILNMWLPVSAISAASQANIGLNAFAQTNPFLTIYIPVPSSWASNEIATNKQAIETKINISAERIIWSDEPGYVNP